MTSPTSPTRFLRSRDDRVLGGVAAGLGRSFGVDPLIFRIALAALVFAGGVGILAYGAALLLVPVDDGTGNPEPREQTWRTGVAVAGGALLVIACFAAIGDGGLWAGDWLFPIALVTALGFLVVRALGHRGPGDDTGHSARSTLRTVAIAALVGTAVLVGLAVVFWGSAWATAAGGGVVVAGVVLALGALLVLAAFRGNRGARWLALPAIVIAFPAAVVSAADVSLDGGVGERTYRPTGADILPAGYRLGAGELVVDLRDLDWSGGRRVALDIDMGVGHTQVVVPPTVCVSARTDVRAGYADVFGRDAGGVDLVHDVGRTPAAGVPLLELDVELGMGAVEVVHRPDPIDGPDRGDRFDDRFDGDADDREDAERRQTRRIADRACTGGTA